MLWVLGVCGWGSVRRECVVCVGGGRGCWWIRGVFLPECTDPFIHSCVCSISHFDYKKITLGSCNGKGLPPCIASRSTVTTSPGLGGGMIPPASMASLGIDGMLWC